MAGTSGTSTASEQAPRFRISPLSIEERDPRLAEFGCVDKSLTEFIASEEALRFEKFRLGRTYLLDHPDGRLIGYFTVSTDGLNLAKIKKQYGDGIPKGVNHIPSLLIGRLAIDREFAGKEPHYGRWAVKYIVGMAQEMAKTVGVRLIVLEAVPKSISFYEKCGFVAVDRVGKNTRNPTMFLDLLKL
ncbi:MAG: GNAT family N-acetyltransferase [Euryarchaeota archaeon]|nr:GNAT family N-acetyltransferase [Euryarchaeota archaeon]